jgi:Tfp pilus assembly protein PilN
MTRIGVDFVRRPPAFSQPGAALLAGGVVAVALSLQQYVSIHQDAAALKESLGSIAATAKRESGRPQIDPEMLRTRIKLANQVVEKRAVPWDALFRDIEAASDKDVGVLSIEPNAGGHVLRITGEARNAAALAAYITRLEMQASLAQVYLADHELRVDKQRTSLRFGLNALWTSP